MSKLLRDIYRSSKKALSSYNTDKDIAFQHRISNEPMNRLAEAVAESIFVQAENECAFEPTAVMGTAAFERTLSNVLSAIDSSDREQFLTLLLTALYYKLAMGNEHAMLSDFHPSFINEEQDS